MGLLNADTPIVTFSNKICVDEKQLPETYRGGTAEKQFYSVCHYGERRLKADTFVLVDRVKSRQTASSTNTINLARILFLYEDEVLTGINSCRAIIQPIVRPGDISKHIKTHPDLRIDESCELLIDMPESITDISVHNVTGKFNLLYCQPAQTPSRELKSIVSKDAKYACRYKIVRLNGKYCILPWTSITQKTDVNTRPLRKSTTADLEVNQNKENTPQKNESAVKRKNTVTPIRIVNNSVQKVTPSSRKTYAGRKSPIQSEEEEPASDSDDSDSSTPRKRLRKSTNNNSKPNACKNLNESLGGDPTDMKYSIEQQDALKVKIRISDKQSKLAQEPGKVATPLRRSSRSSSISYSSQMDTPLKIALINQHSKHAQEPAKVATPTRRASRSSSISGSSQMDTPLKTALVNQHLLATPRSRGRPHKSILKSPSLKNPETPKRSVRVSIKVQENVIESSDESSDNDDEYVPQRTPSKRKSVPAAATKSPKAPRTPSTTTPRKTIASTTTPRKSVASTPSQVRRQIREGGITPSMRQRDRQLDTMNAERSDVQIIKESLHVSAVPKSLPCRETEYNNIMSFIECKILDECGGCMYVSGVPGTGKTATTSEVIRALQLKAKKGKIPDFEFVEINGMKMTEPRQAYVHIYRQLTGKTMGWEQAHTLLEHRFTKQAAHRRTTVLLVDELDILCNRRQDVVYNILDWPTKMAARLVVVTIANTMDLPERLLMGKVTSRLGLTRLTFQPYSHKQLQDVVMARLAGTNMFKSDAVQLVARKVASVSGDCRRALDICRRSIEIAEVAAKSDADVLVSMVHVQQAFTEMISSSKVQAIKGCSKMEQFFLQAVEAEVTRTGVEETSFLGVYTQFESILILMGMKVPAPGRAMLLSMRLGATKLIISESSSKDIHQKILLNVSPDDIHYALHAKI